MGKIIMTVDDSASVRQMVGFTLRDAGYEVLEASDGRDALAKLSGKTVQMVITDLNMPNLDGIGLIRSLRGVAAYKFIPIIMLTRQDTPESFALGMQAGAIDFIPKDPFAMAVLRETLRQMGLINTPERKDSDPDKVD